MNLKSTSSFREAVRAYYKLHRSEGCRAQQALRIAKHSARYGSSVDQYVRLYTDLQRRHHALMPDYAGEEQRYELNNGFYAIVKIEYDDDYGPPWENCDGHGVISDWERRSNTNGRWTLAEDGYSRRYYDWKETLKIAKRDGWGTHNGDLMGAVLRDYEYLCSWCTDQWHYVGLIVELYDAEDELISEDSCWGYESFAEDYLCSEARSWLSRMLKEHRRNEQQTRHAERVANRFRDAMECGV